MSIVHDAASRYRPCLVLAHTDAAFAADTLRRFRRLGWDVYQAQAGPEARRLARMLEPELVVLDADLEGESGWLTCAKLTTERPGGRVVLIADEECPRDQQMAIFVGASAIVGRGGLTALMQANWARPEAA
jgi:DNA-binding response OmpR family regulator